ncbi:hypothetical protein TIFTF001_029849 [Ficus carica]|uniref:Uncharacterized protein n=1 Tax=Ficus carica TaxID=3494 RepID=A0AA88DWK0_FICCA|nr:hypothetical protein TIFTF001_029849 [Ficus carica]
MMTVMAKTSPWQEDGHCGKEQGMNEIVGGGVWSSWSSSASATQFFPTMWFILLARTLSE